MKKQNKTLPPVSVTLKNRADWLWKWVKVRGYSFDSNDRRNTFLYKAETQAAPDDEYEQAFAELTETKDNILIQGSGGTGKTTLIKKFLSHLSQEEYNKTLLVAPTGKVADLIGGTTIHKAFEMNNCIQIPDKVKVLPKMLRNIKTLIIDEFSMVRCDIFDRIIETLQFAKSQGSTFNNVVMVYDSFFESGMLYTALSRCRQLII